MYNVFLRGYSRGIWKNYLHVLSKRAGMSVGLVTHFAKIRFV